MVHHGASWCTMVHGAPWCTKYWCIAVITFYSISEVKEDGLGVKGRWKSRAEVAGLGWKLGLRGWGSMTNFGDWPWPRDPGELPITWYHRDDLNALLGPKWIRKINFQKGFSRNFNGHTYIAKITIVLLDFEIVTSLLSYIPVPTFHTG